MTGRELIIYILNNNLEDEPVYENGRLFGFMTVEQAAAKMGVGPEAIKVWVRLGRLSCVTIGDTMFIPVDAEF